MKAIQPGFPVLWLGCVCQVHVGSKILSFCRDGCVEDAGVSDEVKSLNCKWMSVLCMSSAYGVGATVAHGRNTAITMVEADTCKWDP